ncbi:hypothetical protein PQR02_17430 [Paraburkholderia sediminicola]|uniref:Uncharacterized protein n=1 Tax=Paraburkholderia rhynchosiae TaxID=487049 RepID=A0ACC7N7Z2_9BURK
MSPFYAVAGLAILMIGFGVVVWRGRSGYQFDRGDASTFPASLAATFPDQSGSVDRSSVISRIPAAR